MRFTQFPVDVAHPGVDPRDPWHVEEFLEMLDNPEQHLFSHLFSCDLAPCLLSKRTEYFESMNIQKRLAVSRLNTTTMFLVQAWFKFLTWAAL